MAREQASLSLRHPPRSFVVLCCAIGVSGIAACEADGVTPKCSPDASDCVTAPGDATTTVPDDSGTPDTGPSGDAGAG